MKRLVECVANFSEGRNIDTINAIARSISSVEGVDLLHVDRGEGANRTVFTFIGEPESLSEAAFQAIAAAQRLIDMSVHHGEHPRIGAADVVPFIPISGVTIEETAELARNLSMRVARELEISVYCYEESAFEEHKRNLASCRSGEYEGISSKLTDPRWQPDYGSKVYNDSIRRSGISVIGARNFLVAVNFNLCIESIEIAKKIASKIRYIGYIEDGVRKNGLMQGVKAIGWYIPEYSFAQVSVNITDINLATLDKVWLNICKLARESNIEVTGVEIIGLVPQKVLLDAAKGMGFNHADIFQQMEAVAKEMNFDQLRPFVIEEKVIEYVKPINSMYYGE